MGFPTYTYLEEKVEAIQLSPNTQLEVIKALVVDLEGSLLTKLSVEYSSTSKCYEFTFRYKTDSVESVLTVGNFLVRLNTGNYVVRSAEEFLKNYLNTSVDPIIPEDQKQSPKQSIVSFIKKFFPDAGINTEADLTPEAMKQVVEGMKGWYDAKNDVFDIKFCDCGIVDPTGIADMMKSFPQASYMKDTTTFTLNFNNGAWKEGDPNIYPNQFNYIGLQQLVGELKKIDTATRTRLTAVTFMSVKQNSPSAVAPSVTEAQWNAFCDEMIRVTGVKTSTNLKK